MSKAKKEKNTDKSKRGIVGVHVAAPLALEPMELATGTVAGVPLVRTLGYVVRNVEVKLSRHAAQTLRDLRDGLSQTGCTLKNGKAVETSAAAIAWLLENVELDKVGKKD